MTIFHPKLSLYFLLFFLFLLPSSISSLYFKIPRFEPNTENIICQGDAVRSDGAIELINKINYLCRVGWATSPGKFPLYDFRTKRLADFTTHFSFTIDTENRSVYGHGIAFFLAPVGFQIPPNSAGGFLGLFNTTTNGSPDSSDPIVVIEFDSYPNPEWDPPVEHVGINKNSLSSAVYTPWNASLHSKDNTLVWITYDSRAKNLSVHWSYETTSSEVFTSLSYQIDLAKVLPQWVTVGFSSATGLYGSKHRINSWEFNSTLDINENGGP